jgi:hypothetical protein
VPRSAEQKLRDYLRRKYGNPENIFINRKTEDGVRVPDVQREDKKE